MAKNEGKLEAESNKRKAKKRKQQNQAEDPHEEKVFLEQARKASKRKSEPVEKSPKKRKSHQNDSEDSANSDDEIREPTQQELHESEKPENTLDIETIRQKKQKSHKKNLKIKQDQATLKESERNDQYLTRWKHSRDEWKFEKLRQVSIQKSVLDPSKMSDESFPIALEYLAGTKGAARGLMGKAAEEDIKRLDKEFGESPEAKNDSVKMSRYKRARELVQVLQ